MDLGREKRKLVRRLPALTCTPRSAAECGETARCHWRQTADVRIKLGSHLAPGAEPPSLAAFGGTHGNEWEGQVAVKQLCQQLDPNQISGRVILMPQLSQSACAANQRISPLDNVNMNRAFPGNSRGTISMRIADFVKTRIFPKTRIVIDLHAGGREGGFALCTSFHAVPDAAQFAEIRHAASLFDPPFILIYSSQMAHGLLTDEAEAEGKIGIGGEFGFGEGVSRKGVLHAYEGIRNVMKQYGMLAGAITKIDPMRQSPPPGSSMLEILTITFLLRALAFGSRWLIWAKMKREAN